MPVLVLAGSGASQRTNGPTGFTGALDDYRWPGVARILYLAHSLPPEEYTGTPLTTHGYARSMAARGWDVTVVSPSANAVSWTAAPFRREGEAFTCIEVPRTPHLGARWSIEAPTDDAGGWSQGAAAFRRILREQAPDLVHVVNNVHLPLDVPEMAKAEGVPVVRTVTCAEDLCGLVAPVSPRSGPAGYCSAPLTPEQCARCVEEALAEPGAAPDGEAHRELVAHLVRKRARAAAQYHRVFDRVIFPSHAFRRYFEQTLPLDPARVRVVEMGLDLGPWPPAAGVPEGGRRPRADGEPVVLCLAGAWDPVKVGAGLVEAFTTGPLAERSDYRLVCLGAGHRHLVDPLLANPNVELRGAYRPEDLPAVLADVDVGLAPSNFETFHRVTREYLLAGLPVIGSRAFGILDIIRDGVNGLLFDRAEPGALAHAVTRLLDDRALLDHLTQGAAATRVRSLEDEAEELAALYDDLLAQMRGSVAGALPSARPLPFRRKHAAMR